jgi:hypothetical protein
LPRTQTVRGTLVDPDGKPLNGIRVAVDWLTHPANHGVNHYVAGEQDLGSAMTDQYGNFVIRLPSGARASLYVAEGDRSPHSESSRTLKVPSDGDLVDVVLQAGPKNVSGRAIEVMATAKTKKHAQFGKVQAPDDSLRYRLHLTFQSHEGRKVNRVDARVIHKGSQYASQWLNLSATRHADGICLPDHRIGRISA